MCACVHLATCSPGWLRRSMFALLAFGGNVVGVVVGVGHCGVVEAHCGVVELTKDCY